MMYRTKMVEREAIQWDGAEDTFMAEFSAMTELFWLQFTQILQQQEGVMSNDVPY